MDTRLEDWQQSNAEQWEKIYPPKPPIDLDQWLKDHPFVGPFKPHAWYNKDGDQLEVFWDNESYYGVELKGKSGKSVMCLMRNRRVGGRDASAGNVPVGVTVYSIKKLLEEVGLRIVPIYYKLLIEAPALDVEIWIGDDAGNFVQKGIGVLETSLRPGTYTVEFGLGQPKHTIELTQDISVKYDSQQGTSGGILTET